MPDGAQPGGRKLPVLHKVLLALAVALVTAEVGARVIDARAGRGVDFFLPPDEQLAHNQTHPYIGYVYRPGAERAGKAKYR